MNVSKEFKEKYNGLLTREKNGRNYIDNPARTKDDLDKFIPLYMKICDELSKMIEIYEWIEKKEISPENALEGFKI